MMTQFFLVWNMLLLCLVNGIEVTLYRAPDNITASFFVPGKTVQLSGSILYLGEYYFPLQIGGQTINVQLDSGSSALAVPAVACATSAPQCGVASEFFAPAASSSYVPVDCDTNLCTSCSIYNDTAQCSFEESFGDGSSITGVLGSDIVAVSGLNARASFGMILSETGAFSSPTVPGILGVALPRLDCQPACVTPLMDNLQQQQNVSLVFGLCLSSEGGGLWDVGEVVESRATGDEIFYSPLDTMTGYYAVTLLMVDSSLGQLVLTEAQQVSLQSSLVIIDSGTTLLVVPSWFFGAIQTQAETFNLPGASSLFQQNCLCLTAAEIQQYPTLFFVFASVNGSSVLEVPLPPSNYLLNYQGEVCLGIQSQAANMFVMGDLFLQGMYTVFDRENGTMGFATVKDNVCGVYTTANTFLTSCDGSGGLVAVTSTAVVSLGNSSVLPMPKPVSTGGQTAPAPGNTDSGSWSWSSTSTIVIISLVALVVVILTLGTIVFLCHGRSLKYVELLKRPA